MCCCQTRGKAYDYFKLPDLLNRHCLRGIFPEYTEKVDTKTLKKAIFRFTTVVEFGQSSLKKSEIFKCLNFIL